MTIERVPYESAALIELTDVDDIPNVTGALVKIAPALDPSQSQTADFRAIQKNLLERGAIACTVSVRRNAIPTVGKTVTTDVRDPLASLVKRIQKTTDGDVQRRTLELVPEFMSELHSRGARSGRATSP